MNLNLVMMTCHQLDCEAIARVYLRECTQTECNGHQFALVHECKTGDCEPHTADRRLAELPHGCGTIPLVLPQTCGSSTNAWHEVSDLDRHRSTHNNGTFCPWVDHQADYLPGGRITLPMDVESGSPSDRGKDGQCAKCHWHIG